MGVHLLKFMTNILQCIVQNQIYYSMLFQENQKGKMINFSIMVLYGIVCNIVYFTAIIIFKNVINSPLGFIVLFMSSTMQNT